MMDDDIFNTDKAPAEETKEIKLDDDDDDDPFSLASSQRAADAAVSDVAELAAPVAAAPSTINIQPALQEEIPAPSPPPAVVSPIKKPVMRRRRAFPLPSK